MGVEANGEKKVIAEEEEKKRKGGKQTKKGGGDKSNYCKSVIVTRELQLMSLMSARMLAVETHQKHVHWKRWKV